MKAHFVAAVLVGSQLLFACHKAEQEDKAPAKAGAEAEKALPETPIATVAELVKTKSGVVVDANDSKTRQEYGTVPGALLLSDHKSFAFSELPANKAEKLVFYCGGVKCRASDAAATRAASAGYSNVSVMREGIRGWKSAGQPTEQPRS
jgi:rhodanese-related sulfurtransferase